MSKSIICRFQTTNLESSTTDMMYWYLIERMNHREIAEGRNTKYFSQMVSVHEMSESLMKHGICIFNKHLGKQPVCVHVTGQEDGVLLTRLLMQLRREKKKKS